MKKTRRIIAFTLVICMSLLVFASCGAKDSKPAENNEPAPAQTNAAANNAASAEVVYTINCTQSVPIFEQWQQKFAEYVGELSDGRIGFEFLPTGSLGNSTECLSSCQMGSLDFVHGGDVELGSIVANSDWCSLPYYITSHEQGLEQYMNGFIGEYADKQYAESGLISVSRGDNSFRTIGVTSEVNSSADLKGMRIRIPNQPMAQRIYELMGALPVALNASEVLIALQQHTVDGADNAILLFDQFKQMDFFKTIVMLNYSYGTVNIFCSAETWNKMPAEDQKIIKEAGKKAGEWYHAELVSQEEALIERITKEGMNVVYPDDAWNSELAGYADAIWEDALNSGNYDEDFIQQLYALYLKNTGR